VIVIPAKAGIHLLPTSFTLSSHPRLDNMDSRFRGNDEEAAGMTNLDAPYALTSTCFMFGRNPVSSPTAGRYEHTLYTKSILV
jgi:hypothetical protein